MKSNARPLIPYLRQSRAKERTISIEEQRRDIRAWADAAGVPLAAVCRGKARAGSASGRKGARGV
jgi:hypothetical protein